METIKSNLGGLVWIVISKRLKPVGKKSRNVFTVKCSKCGYRRTGQKSNIQSVTTCAGCEKKPAALKTDDSGNCITICEIGTVEFIRDYQEEYQVSERAAVRQFIETVKAHLPAGDLVAEGLTGDKVRAKIRRDTGKVKTQTLGQSDPNLLDRPKVCGEPPQNSGDDKARRPDPKSGDPASLTSEEPQRYSVAAEPGAIQRFLDKHLPGYRLVKKTALSGQDSSGKFSEITDTDSKVSGDGNEWEEF